MSAVSTNRAATAGSTSIFATAIAAIAAWNDARVTRKALAMLSDRELDDIGLTRADIDTIVSGR